jgi:hypothetical protein
MPLPYDYEYNYYPPLEWKALYNTDIDHEFKVYPATVSTVARYLRETPTGSVSDEAIERQEQDMTSTRERQLIGTITAAQTELDRLASRPVEPLLEGGEPVVLLASKRFKGNAIDYTYALVGIRNTSLTHRWYLTGMNAGGHYTWNDMLDFLDTNAESWEIWRATEYEAIGSSV